MRADYLTYRRAASESIRGLVLQAVLTFAMLIYSVFAHDHAAFTAAAFMGIGIVAWLALAIVFDQHRRERIEAMEVEALAAAPVSGGSVFEKQDDFYPAARRLAVLHKFFLPATSLVMGTLLVTIGVLRFLSAREHLAPTNFSSPGSTFVSKAGWALGLGLIVAFFGFVFARYTAAMAKQTAWANLRAGSSYAVGAAVIGLSMAVAHFVDFWGPDVLVRYLQAAFPILMVVIGVEIFVNFVLGIYRPRKAGEVPRPAFDSRLLSFVAAPDRIAQSISDAINYQLGFDVTSGWFYQLLSRWLLPLAVFGVVIIWALSCLVVVQPHQRAMVLRFGRPVEEDLPPGAHFKLPWPIDSVYVPEYITRDAKGHLQVSDRTVKGVRSLNLGTSPPGTKDPILWTNDHAGEEVFQFVRASAVDFAGSGEGDLADIAMVSVEIPLQYAIKNVRLYDELADPEHRDDLLKAVAQREITLYFQRLALDDILGGQRAEIAAALRTRVQKAFDNLNPGPGGEARGAGVELLSLAISGVHPPKQVAAAFETPVQADQRREANIDNAEADSIQQLAQVVGGVGLARTIIAELDVLDGMKQKTAPASDVAAQQLKVQTLLEGAGGSAAKSLAEARADRWEQHMGSRGRATRYQGMLAMYEANPQLFRANRYFDAMKASLKNARVYITSEEVPNSRVDVHLEDHSIGEDIFKKDK